MRTSASSRLEPDTAPEVDKPVFPGDREQMGVVLVAHLLEVRAQTEQRQGQDAAFGQQQRDQQPADPPIAIDKRMARLELRVRERRMHQHRRAVVVKKPLQSVEARRQLVLWRRHGVRIVERAAGRADPVLAAAELSRSS